MSGWFRLRTSSVLVVAVAACVGGYEGSSKCQRHITNKQGKNEGTVMPPYGMLLGDQIELVRRWIAAGAKND